MSADCLKSSPGEAEVGEKHRALTFPSWTRHLFSSHQWSSPFCKRDELPTLRPETGPASCVPGDAA